MPSVALFSTISNRSKISPREAINREQFLLEELSEMFKARELHDIIDAQIDFIWFATECLYLLKGELFTLPINEDLKHLHSILESVHLEDSYLVTKVGFTELYMEHSLVSKANINIRYEDLIKQSFELFLQTCDYFGICAERALQEVIDANMSKFYSLKTQAEEDAKSRGSDYKVEEVGNFFSIIRVSDQKTMKAKHFKAPDWGWIYE